MKNLLVPLFPREVEQIVKQIKKDPSLLVCHEMNRRAIEARKIYDVFWHGTHRRKREPFYFTLTTKTFRDNLYLFQNISEENVLKAFRGFARNSWDVDQKTKYIAVCVFLSPKQSIKQLEIREKKGFIYPLNPLEVETIAAIMTENQHPLIHLDINWALIDAVLHNRNVNGRIRPSRKIIQQAGNMENITEHNIRMALQLYAHRGWTVKKDGDYWDIIDYNHKAKSWLQDKKIKKACKSAGFFWEAKKIPRRDVSIKRPKGENVQRGINRVSICMKINIFLPASAASSSTASSWWSASRAGASWRESTCPTKGRDTTIDGL